MGLNTVVAIASDLRRCLMGLSPISQVSQAVISICTKYIGPLVKSLAATGKNLWSGVLPKMFPIQAPWNLLWYGDTWS